MNAALVQKFIDALVDDTLHDRLHWCYVEHITDNVLQHYGGKFPFEIFTCEFRQIDEHRSYVCFTNAGLVYLVYSMNYPGDGSDLFDRFELYLHTDPYKPDGYIDLCPEEESELYRLENAVRRKVSDSLHDNRFGERGKDYYLELFLRERR